SALVPNLVPKADAEMLDEVQRAWEAINNRSGNDRGGTRIITRESEDCVTAGAELLGKGIEVRVAKSLNTESLSYHVFTGDAQWTILNNRADGRDRPIRIDGLSASKIYQNHFETVWKSSIALESVLAEQVLTSLRSSMPASSDLAEQLRDIRVKYHLDR